MKISGYGRSTKAFAPFKVDMANTAAESGGAQAPTTTSVDVSAIPSSARRFIGGLSMADGSIIMLPGHSDVGQFYKYNPFSDAVSPASSLGAWGGGGSFRGGATLSDGVRIVLAPYSHADVKVFNASSGTMVGLPTGSAVTNKYSGAVTLQDGRVLLVPYGESSIKLVSADGSALIAGPAHGEGATAFSGGILLPSGKVLLIPASSEYFGLYDPALNSYSRAAPAGKVVSTADQWSGAVYAPNGKVVMIPGADSRILVFDPATMSFEADPVRLPTHTGLWYSGGAALADGRIVFVQNTTTVQTRMYDAEKKEVTDGPLINMGGVFQGGVPMIDGRVLLVPLTATAAVAYKATAGSKGYSDTARRSPWINKSV